MKDEKESKHAAGPVHLDHLEKADLESGNSECRTTGTTSDGKGVFEAQGLKALQRAMDIYTDPRPISKEAERRKNESRKCILLVYVFYVAYLVCFVLLCISTYKRALAERSWYNGPKLTTSMDTFNWTAVSSNERRGMPGPNTNAFQA